MNDMPYLPVFETVARAYNVTFSRSNWAIWPFKESLILATVASPLISLIFGYAVAICFALLLVAGGWLSIVLFGPDQRSADDARRRWSGMRRLCLSFVAAVCIIKVLPLILYVVAFIFLYGHGRSEEILKLGVFVFSLIAAFLLVRITLLFPAFFATPSFDFKKEWSLSGESFFQIGIICVFTFLPLSLPKIALAYLLENKSYFPNLRTGEWELIEMLNIPAWALLVLAAFVGTSALAIAYRTLSGLDEKAAV